MFVLRNNILAIEGVGIAWKTWSGFRFVIDSASKIAHLVVEEILSYLIQFYSF